jgi:hypothetical protein
VNRAGLAVLVHEDSPRGEPSLRLLAQDLLLRAPGVEAALEHARRRAPYLRQSGALLVSHAESGSRRVELRAGELRTDGEPAALDSAHALVRIDPARRSLRIRLSDAETFEVGA